MGCHLHARPAAWEELPKWKPLPLCHCFPFNLTPDSCFGFSTESRKTPHTSPVHRFGWRDEGGALKLHLHCLHQPQEPFMGAEEVPPSPGPLRGPHDGQAGPGCAVPKPGPVQSSLCHLWAILPPSSRVLRPKGYPSHH